MKRYDVYEYDVIGFEAGRAGALREELLAEISRSGLSGAHFAALAGVYYQTFMGWVNKQYRRSGRTVSAQRRPLFRGNDGPNCRARLSADYQTGLTPKNFALMTDGICLHVDTFAGQFLVGVGRRIAASRRRVAAVCRPTQVAIYEQEFRWRIISRGKFLRVTCSGANVCLETAHAAQVAHVADR